MLVLRRVAGKVSHMRDSERRTPDSWATYSRAAREAAKLSQAQLAKLIGVTRQTINRWEAGKYRPEHPVTVEWFATATRVDLDEALAAAGLRPGMTPPSEPAPAHLIPKWWLDAHDPDRFFWPWNEEQVAAWRRLQRRLADPDTPEHERAQVERFLAVVQAGVEGLAGQETKEEQAEEEAAG